MLTWAHVFITSPQPKKVLRILRRVHGVVHADALFGSPDLIAIVAGDDIARMDAVIDRIAEIPLVVGTDSKVARWIDGVAFPLPGPPGLGRNRPSKRRGPGMKRLTR